MDSFKLAMAQMLVVGGEPEKNLARAGEMIARSAQAGAALALLPECVDFGWNHPSGKERAGSIPDGETCRFLCDAARRHRLYVCSGLVERQGDMLYNSAVLINPQGEIILHHRKLNEILPGLATYAQGDRLGVAHTPLGTLGLMICGDGFAEGQVIGRTLGYMGADVIFSPAAFAVPPHWDNAKTPCHEEWRPHLAPVARDFELWIATVSNVGSFPHPTDGELPCIGCSLVYDPDGEQALCGPYGRDAEELLFIDITPRPRPARGCGWPGLWKERGRHVAEHTARASGFFS